MKIIILSDCDTIQSSKSMQTLPQNLLRSTLGQMTGDTNEV
jgi:hypothetical protein